MNLPRVSSFKIITVCDVLHGTKQKMQTNSRKCTVLTQKMSWGGNFIELKLWSELLSNVTVMVPFVCTFIQDPFCLCFLFPRTTSPPSFPKMNKKYDHHGWTFSRIWRPVWFLLFQITIMASSEGEYILICPTPAPPSPPRAYYNSSLKQYSSNGCHISGKVHYHQT